MADFAQQKENEGRTLAMKYFPYFKFNFTTPKFKEVDFYASTKKGNYVGDIKAYTNYPRPYDKHNPKDRDGNIIEDKGYQIDFNKLYHIEKEAINNNLTPILIVFFTDTIIAWDLTNINWKERGKWVYGNTQGGECIKKEWDYQTFLYKGEAKVVMNYE